VVDQYFQKNHRLFKIPFKLLLFYHCPLGNTIKEWTSHLMVSHILIVRNDINILNMAFTIIQIRKALNTLFKQMLSRGSFLIYAPAYESLKLDNRNVVFTFVTSWLPGLISNYKQVITALSYNKKAVSLYGPQLFKRTQADALIGTKFKPVPNVSAILRPSRVTRFPRVPSISFSVADSFIWLNECHNLNIPSIQICDTRSLFDKIQYPIISNQRSIPFTQLLINVFSETCNYALIFEHFHFTIFFKSLGMATKYNKYMPKDYFFFLVIVQRLFEIIDEVFIEIY